MRVGVLALQGAFIEHIQALSGLGAEAFPVRLPRQLDGIDGLVIPGGESTTISKLMDEYGLVEPVRRLAQGGAPILGTCAGMILLAGQVDSLEVAPLGLIDITVRRNAFGRQVDSFETDLAVPAIGRQPFHAVFIRAPVVTRVGPGVEVLCRLPDNGVVGVRQGRVMALAFHPELTGDARLHRYFLKLGSGVAFAESNCR